MKSSLPCNESLDSQAVLASGLCPGVRGVDWGVAIHVGTVLVGKSVHTKALQNMTEAFKTHHMPIGTVQAQQYIFSQNGNFHNQQPVKGIAARQET